MGKPLRYLGDVLGSLRYFGQCGNCGTQFMSTRDRVQEQEHSHVLWCEKCASKPRAEGTVTP